jgi:hypothetical protein
MSLLEIRSRIVRTQMLDRIAHGTSRVAGLYPWHTIPGGMSVPYACSSPDIVHR